MKYTEEEQRMLAEIKEMERDTAKAEKEFYLMQKRAETTSIEEAISSFQKTGKAKCIVSTKTAEELFPDPEIASLESEDFLTYLKLAMEKAYKDGMFDGLVTQPENLGISFENVFEDQNFWLERVLVWNGEEKTPYSYRLECDLLMEFFGEFFSGEALYEYTIKDKIYYSKEKIN